MKRRNQSIAPYCTQLFVALMWPTHLAHKYNVRNPKVPRRATLLWVPGATHDSAAIYRGPMEAMASKGYRSVALRLRKSRYTSLGNYVRQAHPGAHPGCQCCQWLPGQGACSYVGQHGATPAMAFSVLSATLLQPVAKCII